MRKLVVILGFVIVALGATPRVVEPTASASTPSPTISTIPTAIPTISYQTIRQASPLTVINVARIPAGAAVKLKAVLSPQDSRGYFMALPTDIAKSLGALLVVNADIHLFDGVPIGGVVSDGIQIRPTVRDHAQLSLDASNHFTYTNHGEIPLGSIQSLGASYHLLENSVQLSIPEHSDFTESRQARTLVGWNIQTGEIIFATVDKGLSSSGMSLNQAADLMLRLGATDAANLDGGGSTQMVASGELRNAPSSGPRPVSNFWVVLPKDASPGTPK